MGVIKTILIIIILFLILSGKGCSGKGCSGKPRYQRRYEAMVKERSNEAKERIHEELEKELLYKLKKSNESKPQEFLYKIESNFDDKVWA